MSKNRLEAFSDGVLAIIITIMVLDLKVPHGTTLEALVPLIPAFVSYLLSFAFIAIYWNNHHHVMHAVTLVNGAALWANMNLLFWLSLVSFVTGWLGENQLSTIPAVCYGFVLLMAAIAFGILTRVLLNIPGQSPVLARALGTKNYKNRVSPILYLSGIGLSFLHPWLGIACYVIVAIMWLIPDPRIEKNIGEAEHA